MRPGRGGHTRCGSCGLAPTPAEFFAEEFATAVAGSIPRINPFDQPDVQAAKDKTNEVLAAGEPRSRPRARSTSCSTAPRRPATSASGVHRSLGRNGERIDRLARSSRERTGCVDARLRAPVPAFDRAASGRPRHQALSRRRGLRRGLLIPGKPFGLAVDPRPGRRRRLIPARARRRVARVQLEEVSQPLARDDRTPAAWAATAGRGSPRATPGEAPRPGVESTAATLENCATSSTRLAPSG